VTGILEYLQRLASEAYHPGTIVIELLIIGLVVYTILRFLEGTPGAGLLKGMGLLAVIGFLVVDVLATRFDWARIGVLYRYFITAAFLTALVVFQPELRRGLARLSEARWLRRFLENPDTVVEPVVAAVAHLSKNKIGALIAIEHEVGLGRVIESGVRLDAQLSSDLLNTIFWPGSALHDMGVVIREQRVVAAACQFPLSEHHEVDRSLGSRHRAALGMSAESDATVIVVSEETGLVSLAKGGQLDRGLEPEALRARLTALLHGGGTGGNGRVQEPRERNAA